MTTRQRLKRWLVIGLLAAAVVVALGIIGYKALDQPSWIYYYRVADEQHLLLGTISGPGANVRVTDVVETPETVTITVSTFLFEIGATSGVGYPYESEATLSAPLGTRSVIDGGSGLPVRRASCPWPSYFASPCP